VRDWSVVSWSFLAVLFGTALVAWAGWRLLHRMRHRPLAVLVLTVALVLSTAGVASAVNRYFLYLPQVGDVINLVDGEHDWPGYAELSRLPPATLLGRYPHGVVVHLAIPDRGSGFGQTGALAYLPPQYFSAPERRFPVVYLLHGAPGVPADWFRGGGAEQTGARLAAAGQPMIIVPPRMSRGWLDDSECVDSVHEPAETHLVTDVIPAVDGTLRTVPRRTARALGGMSAGGYCALNLGLRHRDLFGTIIAMSGTTAPTYPGGPRALFGAGPAAEERIRTNSPQVYAPTLSATPPTRIWLDCGVGDAALVAGLRSIAAVLQARGLATQLHVRPGSHTFHVWRPALAEALAWAAPTLTAGT
jgi:enterochelin esterase-like enzyme